MCAPPHKAFIKITEPIQACHSTPGWNLEDQCVPVGICCVSGEVRHDNVSHWLFLKLCDADGTLIDFEDKLLHFCIGYHGSSQIDWRGIKKYEPKVAA